MYIIFIIYYLMSDIGYAYIISNNEYYIINITLLILEILIKFI